MTDQKDLQLSRRTMMGATAALCTTGCYGSFNLTGIVYDWNGSFSSKWVRWLIFLGLVIVPVCAVMLFVDAFILNTIEFFSGEHPVERTALRDGSTMTAEKTEDPKTTRIRHEQGGEPLAVFLLERRSDEELILRNASGETLSHVTARGERIELRDARGRLLVAMDEEARQRAIARAQREGSVGRALTRAIAESDSSARVAEVRRRIAL